MARTANVFARVEPEVKEQAEQVLERLGIPMSNDIYGLDSADIEENKYVDNVSSFEILAGFRSWYILQHCNLYGGDYQPFITYAS